MVFALDIYAFRGVYYKSMFLTILIGLIVAGGVSIIVALHYAADGYQDEKGFHYGNKV